MAQLDIHFQDKKIEVAHLCMDKFLRHRRKQTERITTWLSDSAVLYSHIEKINRAMTAPNCTFPEWMLACCLYENANLAPIEKQIIQSELKSGNLRLKYFLFENYEVAKSFS